MTHNNDFCYYGNPPFNLDTMYRQYILNGNGPIIRNQPGRTIFMTDGSVKLGHFDVLVTVALLGFVQEVRSYRPDLLTHIPGTHNTYF
jgi:hypothetical protein